MDAKVNEIDREVGALSKEFARFISSFDRLEQKLDEIHRESGASQGRVMSQQIDDLEQKINKMDEHMTQTTRDTHATRKLVEYGDTRLKEIMRALTLIYRNTDELEGNLIDAESVQTSN